MGVEITRTSQSHPELVSGSHCEPILILLRGQILKRVQDDHQFSSVVFCYIEVQKKLKAHYSLLTTQRPFGRRGTVTLILKNHRTRTILSSPHPDHTSQKTLRYKFKQLLKIRVYC